MTDIRLVAVDIDGTLLGPDHTLSSYAHQAKALCDERDVMFTVATGRVSSSAERVAREMNIVAPVISNGGAAIKVPGGQYLMVRAVPQAAVGRALEIARLCGVERYAYTCERYITETPGPHIQPYSTGIGIPIDPVADLNEHALEGTISLVFRMDRNAPEMEAKVSDLKARLERVAGGDFRVNRTLPHLLEVLEPRACKGEALRALCSITGVPVEQSMAIGDDLGDIDMLEAAGVGVLVANAADYLKTPGSNVTRGSYAEGVYEAVMRYVVGHGR